MMRIPALLRLAPLRQLVSPCAPPARRHPQQQRFYAADAKTPSEHAQFYKTFGRPIFKVALMAIFTYQLGYYAWTYLETSEVQSEAAATIADLEKRIEELERSSAKKP